MPVFFTKLVNKIKTDFIFLISLIILLSIISFILSIILKSLDIVFINTYIASFLNMLAISGITASIFQVIVKSRAFAIAISEYFDTSAQHWESYSNESIKKVIESITKAKDFIRISYDDKKQRSIDAARTAFMEQQSTISKKNSMSSDEEHILHKKYFIKESRILKTITKNGCEISTFELDIEYINNGNFIFRFESWTENSLLEYEPFQYFIDSSYDKRFNDFSFSCKYFNLVKRGVQIVRDRYAPVSYVDIVDDPKKKGFKVFIKIDDSFEAGDIFTLAFSITIKDAFTDESIDRITRQIDPKPYSVTSTPVGVRKITIQEEVYCNPDNNIRIRPTLQIGAKTDEPTEISDSIFYKKYSWTIFYEDTKEDKITYSVI